MLDEIQNRMGLTFFKTPGEVKTRGQEESENVMLLRHKNVYGNVYNGTI